MCSASARRRSIVLPQSDPARMHESQEPPYEKFILVAPSDRKTAHAILPWNAFRGDVVGSMTLVRLATAKGEK